MNTHAIFGSLAIAGALALGSTAVTAEKQNATQTPAPTQTAPRPAQPVVRAGGSAETITLVGCLYNERDIPGRAPNTAERAGVMEDYILAGASMIQGTAPTTGKMYKVELIADEKLRAHVGKRVELTGRIDADRDDVQRTSGGATTAAPDKSPSKDSIELPEFEAASIKEVAGTCPAKPGS